MISIIKFRIAKGNSRRTRISVIAVMSLLLSTPFIFSSLQASAAVTTVTACKNLKTGGIRLTTGSCTKNKEVRIGKLVIPSEVAPSPTPTTTRSATPTPTPVPLLTCAQGGKCQVGDTGPGGGIVFYVQVPTPEAPWRYMEVARSGWGARESDPRVVWCSEQRTLLTDFMTGNAVGPNTSTFLGSGFSNTQTMIWGCTYGAAHLATSYHGGGFSDWYLPSKDELNQLCKYVHGQPWISNATVCASSTPTTFLGWTSNYYWSSSESSAQAAAIQYKDGGSQLISSKSELQSVRPIRAF